MWVKKVGNSSLPCLSWSVCSCGMPFWCPPLLCSHNPAAKQRDTVSSSNLYLFSPFFFFFFWGGGLTKISTQNILPFFSNRASSSSPSFVHTLRNWGHFYHWAVRMVLASDPSTVCMSKKTCLSGIQRFKSYGSLILQNVTKTSHWVPAGLALWSGTQPVHR